MNWSSEENIKISYRLLTVKGYGPVQANHLLWSLRPSVLSALQLEQGIANMLNPKQIETFNVDFMLYRHTLGVDYLSVLDDDMYPSDLRNSMKQNSPTVISYMGNIELLKKYRIGFSGSRKVSDKGMWIAQDCASQLAVEDICLVSGYANGVDMIAHKTALKNGATTIIVLPEGISFFYIRNELKEVWDWNRVLVISEFMPQDKWMASRAMRRNQTIIGLSDAMFVIEAGETGGSFDAGMKTIAAGKSLFVPEYGEIPISALGNNILLKRGAKSLRMNRESGRTNLDKLMNMMTEKKTDYSLFR